MNNVLVVAAHPDDEILGVGGTVKRLSASGYAVHCLILGEGQTSRSTKDHPIADGVVESLHHDCQKAAAAVGYASVQFSDFPDNRFDQVDLLDITKVVEEKIDQLQPEMVFTHCGRDLNIDHQRTCQAVLTATRPIGDFSVKAVYAFETLSSSEWNFSENVFKPNYFVDITDFYAAKQKAMEYYLSELRQFPHPRSIAGMDALARLRGSVISCFYAEAFEILRMVDR